MIRRVGIPLFLLVFFGCTATNNQSPGDTTAASGDEVIGGDGITQGDSATNGDEAGPAGDGTCDHLGPLGVACNSDCDCEPGTACRGLPGAKTCAIPCLAWDDCDGVEIGCANPVCDATIAACRCSCQDGDCGDEVCVAGHCVGCADDDHCRDHSCGSDPGLDTPRCELASEVCICGGKCGDDVCDEAEASAGTCPTDCTGPCVDGEILDFSCGDGQRLAWCTCSGGEWDCVDPLPGCMGDTPCQRAGGRCVEQADYCYEGQIAVDPQGCTDTSPLCCEPVSCSGPGVTYYPGDGICCPGLRALDSSILMENYSTELPGMVCFANCWSLTCAPCGDGACQPHLSENPCTCPEDCPMPPLELVCEYSESECGRGFCRQEGASCHQERPACADQACSTEVLDLAGQVCNRVRGECQ